MSILSKKENLHLVRRAKELATQAGYEGVDIARNLLDLDDPVVGKLAKHVREVFADDIQDCWMTYQRPGNPGIEPHAHHRPTVVYFPMSHPQGMVVDSLEFGFQIEHKALEGQMAYMPQGEKHWTEPTKSKDRVTVVLTLKTRIRNDTGN